MHSLTKELLPVIREARPARVSILIFVASTGCSAGSSACEDRRAGTDDDVGRPSAITGDMDGEFNPAYECKRPKSGLPGMCVASVEFCCCSCSRSI